MRAPGSLDIGDDWYAFTVPGGAGMIAEVFSEHGQGYGAGRPWFVWSRQRGRERCIVDDFGSLVVVA